MRFGLQKLTLLDFPGLVACTVFTCGCNFRCPFCHNADLVTGNEDNLPLSKDELMDYLAGRVGKLDGVCITGGEPLLHAETPELIRQISKLGYRVKLDTNGTFPGRLNSLLQDKSVDYVAMDIKNSPGKYALTCGNAAALEQIKISIGLLKSSSIDYEFRTTVTGLYHTPEDIAEIGRMLTADQVVPKRYFLQPFKYSGNILQFNEAMEISDALLAGMLENAREFIPVAEIRGR